MKILVPLWRWRRIVERRVFVKGSSPADMYLQIVNVSFEFMEGGITLCASSRATILPISVSCSRYSERHMLKSAEAASDVMHGHERSTMVSWPGCSILATD
jgi:hypothetical protein